MEGNKKRFADWNTRIEVIVQQVANKLQGITNTVNDNGVTTHLFYKTKTTQYGKYWKKNSIGIY